MNRDMSLSVPQKLTVQQVQAWREQLWDCGYRPVALTNFDDGGTSPGKRPVASDWTGQARQDPPPCAVKPPSPGALNTGILCDGLRAIDIDVDDGELARYLRAFVLDMFGEAPMRYRDNSGRALILYRAAQGQPPKRQLVGEMGKVEVLGHGQQFAALGIHDTGAVLRWMPESPLEVQRDTLPAVTEQQISDLFDRIYTHLGAKTPSEDSEIGPHAPSPLGQRGITSHVIAQVESIPNQGPADWEWWNKVGMAIWAATGGSAAGLAVFHSWSEKHVSYDPEAVQARWAHYAKSPPTKIGAGTLFHLARKEGQTEDRTEAPEEDAQPGGEQHEKQQKKAEGDELPLLFFKDIHPVLDVRDFVQGVLMEEGAAVVYGESNAGKTFWTTDLALHVAAGHEWNGQRVDQGGVVYCVLEGGIGFRNRVHAWKADRGLDDYDLPFAAIPASLNLLDPNADTDRLIAAINRAVKAINMPVKLVVIDTLSRALAGGNENAPEDMGALVVNMDKIRSQTKACVLFVHHSGKDSAKGARGHSLLRAAIDTEIEVVAEDGSAAKSATVVKQREMKKGAIFSFTLREIELGANRHGEQVTTCVVDPAGDNVAVGATAPRLKGDQKRALEVLRDLLIASGRLNDRGVPSGCASVPEKFWRDRFYESAKAGADADTKQKAFRRAADALVTMHVVGMAGGRVWIVARSPEPASAGPEGSNAS